jgi:uncharacterized membrane protein
MSASILASGLQASAFGLAIAAGLTGGMTFAFSNFIIRAFDRLDGSAAVRAMQEINLTVINPLFMLIFMGTGFIALAVLVAKYFALGRLDPWLLAGTVIYLFGVCAVTAGGNVPLNDALAEVTGDTMTATAWRDFASPWLTYNHLRTVAAAVASLAFMVAASR